MLGRFGSSSTFQGTADNENRDMPDRMPGIQLRWSLNALMMANSSEIGRSGDDTVD